MSQTKMCKWLSDDFNEICVNGDCPYRADFCPVTEFPDVCKYAEFEGDDNESHQIKARPD